MAGGHGALAGLFLILTIKVQWAIVIDPAIVANGKACVTQAWALYFCSFSNNKNEDE